MKFFRNNIGSDLTIADDDQWVQRVSDASVVGCRTLAFVIPSFLAKNMQCFVLEFDTNAAGFGKVGLCGDCLGEASVANLTAVAFARGRDPIWLSELPPFDGRFQQVRDEAFRRPVTSVHLMLLLSGLGNVHYFVNYTHCGVLFAGVSPLAAVHVFFDVSGGLRCVHVSTFDGSPPADVLPNQHGLRLYHSECARGARLCCQTNLTVLMLSEATDVLDEIIEENNFTEQVEQKKLFLKANCNIISGSLTPTGWSTKIPDKLSKESSFQKTFINDIGRNHWHENSCLEESMLHPDSLEKKLSFFDAERYALLVVDKLKQKPTDKKVQEPSSFSDLSIDLPNHMREPVEEMSSSMNPDQLPLIETLISFFMKETPNREEKKIKERTYSMDSNVTPVVDDGSLEIIVNTVLYKSITQFQITLAMGLREPGPHLLMLDIDKFLLNPDSTNLQSFAQILEQWLWLFLQRGPGQIGTGSVLILLCYNRATFEFLSSEKMIPNIQFVKKSAQEVCAREEFQSIIQGDAILLGPPSIRSSEKMGDIKKAIQNSICSSQNLTRFIPRKWLKFASVISQISKQQTKLMSFGQICQMTAEHDCKDIEAVITMLDYLSNLGMIDWIGDKSYRRSDEHLSPNSSRILEAQASIVVSDKSWLLKILYSIEISSNEYSYSSESIEAALKSFSYHKPLFLLLLKHPCLAIEDITRKSIVTVFDFPLQPKRLTDEMEKIDRTRAVELIFQFNQPLPFVNYLSVLLAVLAMSSDNDANIINRQSASATVRIEDYHELRISYISQTSILIVIQTENLSKIRSDILAKVRQYLEQHVQQMSFTHLHRLTCHILIRCPCNTSCARHNKRKCTSDLSCMHFLRLDEVLCNQAVFCGPRRISTSQWRDLFRPFPSDSLKVNNTQIIPCSLTANEMWNVEAQIGGIVPHWIKSLANLLNTSECFTWQILANKLGYKESLRKFEEDSNPALAILVDWVLSSGNNHLSVDFLNSTLQECGQHNMSNVIESDLDCQWLQPQIFISYQWHNQKEAREISDYLLRLGYTTWMDVGQMGGGDFLMHRIEHAIRGCRVFVACITPRYVVSTICHRELVLADLLKKPIIPVMVSKIPWPPPGGTGLLLAPYIYIDLLGVGGHGGSGIKSDIAARFEEIFTQVSKYCSIQITNKDSQKYLNDSPENVSPRRSNSNVSLSADQHPVSEQNQSALHAATLPAASQASVRECSSICTIL